MDQARGTKIPVLLEYAKASFGRIKHAQFLDVNRPSKRII
jgi:hypothetical protein